MTYYQIDLDSNDPHSLYGCVWFTLKRFEASLKLVPVFLVFPPANRQLFGAILNPSGVKRKGPENKPLIILSLASSLDQMQKVIRMMSPFIYASAILIKNLVFD